MVNIFDQILYIGTRPEGPGGIACVLRMYSENIDNFNFVETSYAKYSWFRKIWLIFVAIWKTIKYLSSSKIKLVHIHSSSHISFYRKSIFVLLSKCWRKKVVFHIHGGFFVPFYKSNKKYCNYIFSKVDEIVVVSEYLKLGLCEAGIGRGMSVCYNPIYPPCMPAQVPSTDGRVQVLFFGTLNENKGVLSILECCKKYKSYLESRICLHIGGVGQLNREVERLVADGLSHFVVFHGWVEGEKKIQLQSNADIYLQPSQFESLGIAIIEAMSYKTAIIASNRGGIPELVEDGVNGFLVEPNDEDMLYDKLKALVENQSLRISMAEQSQQKSKAFFVGHIVSQISELYSRVLNCN